MFATSIKKRVMKVIDAKIKEAQKEYEKGCVEIDRDAENQKSVLAEEKVKQIIGKIM